MEPHWQLQLLGSWRLPPRSGQPARRDLRVFQAARPASARAARRRWVTCRVAELGRLLAHATPRAACGRTRSPRAATTSRSEPSASPLEHEPLRGRISASSALTSSKADAALCRVGGRRTERHSSNTHAACRRRTPSRRPNASRRSVANAFKDSTNTNRPSGVRCTSGAFDQRQRSAASCSARRRAACREPGTVRRTRQAIPKLAARAARGGHRTKLWPRRATATRCHSWTGREQLETSDRGRTLLLASDIA